MQIKKIFYENNSHIKGKNKASKLGSQKNFDSKYT